MAYSAVPTVTTGDLWTAANHNTYVRDNFAAGVPDIFTAKGDLAVGTGADAAGKLGVGSDGQVLVADAAEATGVKWAYAGLPIGGIIIWSGAVVDIPSGFSLCNGSNGTPDLRGRFVVGAGGSYNPGDSGGAATHTHTQGNVGNESSHTHSQGNTGNESSHTHSQGNTGSESSHTHGVSGTTGGSSNPVNASSGGTSASADGHTHTFNVTSGAGSSHNHTNPTTGAGSSHSHTNPTTSAGSAHAHTNPTTDASSSLPPYYALCFIMRTT